MFTQPTLPIERDGGFWHSGEDVRWALDTKGEFWINNGQDGIMRHISPTELRKEIDDAQQAFMEDVEKVNKALKECPDIMLRPMTIHGW